MKVLLFHPVRLPPNGYGGTERVVWWLAQGLRDSGHEVTVAALEGSELPRGVKLFPVSEHRKSAEILLGKLPQGIEVVHFHAPPENGVMEKLGCPSIVTVHGNGTGGEKFPKNTVFISKNHAQRHHAQAFVYNGVDPSEFRFESVKNDHLLFLAKTSWKVKNLSGAVNAVLQTGRKLEIAGGSRPYSLRALSAVHPRLKWLGSIDSEKKRQALASASALFFPVLWDEPFGLVVIEALLSGTPVIGSKRGSLPELVTTDVGFLSNEPMDWVETLNSARFSWDPAACRDRAMKYFHFHRMTEGYLSVYQRVIRGDVLHSVEPYA